LISNLIGEFSKASAEVLQQGKSIQAGNKSAADQSIDRVHRFSYPAPNA
jgi:hypothetical protein